MPASSAELARGLGEAAEWLRRGGVVAFPTDTVAGLGCKASLPEAVRAIFELKGRNSEKPLVLFVETLEAAEGVTGPLPARVKRLLSLCWPGALTAVLPLAVVLPGGVGRAGTVGVRIPAHPVPRSLVRLLGGPLATTSANRSGEPPLRQAGEARAVLGEQVLALEGMSGSYASTLADFTVWPPLVLRPGALTETTLHNLVTLAS